jgi:hypothetical protein
MYYAHGAFHLYHSWADLIWPLDPFKIESLLRECWRPMNQLLLDLKIGVASPVEDGPLRLISVEFVSPRGSYITVRAPGGACITEKAPERPRRPELEGGYKNCCYAASEANTLPPLPSSRRPNQRLGGISFVYMYLSDIIPLFRTVTLHINNEDAGTLCLQ